MSDRLSSGQNFRNYIVITQFLYRFSKSISKDQKQVFQTKYDIFTVLCIYQTMSKYQRFWGRFTQFIIFVSMARYFVKGKRGPSIRFGIAWLYIYWINHFYTLGSFFGTSLNLPHCNNIMRQLPKQSSGYKSYLQLLQLIRQRQENKQNQIRYLTDNAILKRIFNQKEKNQQPNVINSFFFQNSDKYFDSIDMDYQDQLKLRYFDHFLTRYAYWVFVRWAGRVGQYFNSFFP